MTSFIPRRVTTLMCAACGEPMARGEALRVSPFAAGEYTVHRSPIRAGCLEIAGPATVSAIALFDPAAARQLDRADLDYQRARDRAIPQKEIA